MPKLIPKTLKQNAILLRKKGFSQNELVKALGISKSTASVWTKGMALSPKAKSILEVKRQKGGFKMGNVMWRKKKNFHRRYLWPNDKLAELKKLYNSGLSMKETAQRLGSTLNCVSSVMHREGIVMRSPAETNRIKFYRSPLSFNFKTNLTTQEKKLKIAALMLYWAEGYKKGSGIDIANSDPKILAIFLKFLRTICQVDESRLRIYLYCHTEADVETHIDFWSKYLEIKPNKFQQPYVRNNFDPKHAKIRHGVAHIRYADKRLLEHILKEIELCYNTLL